MAWRRDSSSSTMEINGSAALMANGFACRRPRRNHTQVWSGADVQGLGHPHQVGQRARAHLPHRRAAVDLHGDLRQRQLARHLLVELAGGDQSHDLSLAWGEGGETLL